MFQEKVPRECSKKMFQENTMGYNCNVFYRCLCSRKIYVYVSRKGNDGDVGGGKDGKDEEGRMREEGEDVAIIKE